MIFGIAYLRSRENMSMIEKGMNPRQIKSTPRPFISLKYGLLFIGVGLGLLIARLVDVNMSHSFTSQLGNMQDGDNPAIYFALVGIGGGAGLVISYAIEKKYWLDKNQGL